MARPTTTTMAPTGYLLSKVLVACVTQLVADPANIPSPKLQEDIATGVSHAGCSRHMVHVWSTGERVIAFGHRCCARIDVHTASTREQPHVRHARIRACGVLPLHRDVAIGPTRASTQQPHTQCTAGVCCRGSPSVVYRVCSPWRRRGCDLERAPSVRSWCVGAAQNRPTSTASSPAPADRSKRRGPRALPYATTSRPRRRCTRCTHFWCKPH